jgi:hypothetical protein
VTARELALFIAASAGNNSPSESDIAMWAFHIDRFAQEYPRDVITWAASDSNAPPPMIQEPHP